MDRTIIDATVLAQVWFEHGVCGVVHFGNAATTGFGAGGVWFGQAQPRIILARRIGGHSGQYAGWRGGLVDGFWCAQGGRQIPPLNPPRARTGVARKTRPQSLPARVAARYW